MENKLNQSSRWPWFLLGCTSLFMFSLALLVSGLAEVANIQYRQMEMKQLPLITEQVLTYEPYLWVAALAGSIAGGFLMWRKGLGIVIPWCLFATTISLTLCAVATYGLAFPLTKVQGGVLSR